MVILYIILGWIFGAFLTMVFSPIGIEIWDSATNNEKPDFSSYKSSILDVVEDPEIVILILITWPVWMIALTVINVLHSSYCRFVRWLHKPSRKEIHEEQEKEHKRYVAEVERKYREIMKRG